MKRTRSNGGPWPDHLEKKWGGDHPTPSISDIIESLPASSTDGTPASPHGFLALVVTDSKARDREKRRRKAAKRKRDRLGAAKQAGTAPQAAADGAGDMRPSAIDVT